MLALLLALLGCAGGQAPMPSAPAAALLPTVTATPAPATASATPAPATATMPASPVPPTPSPAPSPTPAIVADLVVQGVTLIDGTGVPPLPDALVAIRDGRIVAAGPRGSVSIAAGAQLIELPGATLLPGFVNAHVHSADLEPDGLRAWTRAGVTTVRDLSGPLELLVTRKRAFGLLADPALPRLRIAGPMVSVAGGHPIPIYGLNDRVLTVSGPDDARAQAQALIDAGVDQIKIAVSGRTDVSWPELSNAEIAAIAETAHAAGIKVTAHVDRAAALRRAVESGIDDAAHMPRDAMPDELIALMVERGVALVPTIDVYENLAEERGDAAAWRTTTLPIMYDNLGRFVAAGGRLALGDDYGNPRVTLGLPLDELRHWRAAGLSPMQALVAATQGGAIVCGLDAELGTIAVGKRADLFVVEGDPLADLEALARVRLVLREGAIVVGP
jgi:imidazolonepropionase-like amidohydrolase